jgi:GTPase involved in cell partitioning and DNA repair
MMRIEPQYIKESERIIKNYNTVIAELAVFEKTLSENKDLLLKLKDDIDDLKNSKGTELLKKQKLFEVMNGYDKEIVRLQDIMLPYVAKLEKLKKESSILYKILKEKHPGASDKQLQAQIFKQLDEELEKRA